jgi:hypothetical protein
LSIKMFPSGRITGYFCPKTPKKTVLKADFRAKFIHWHGGGFG